MSDGIGSHGVIAAAPPNLVIDVFNPARLRPAIENFDLVANLLPHTETRFSRGAA